MWPIIALALLMVSCGGKSPKLDDDGGADASDGIDTEPDADIDGGDADVDGDGDVDTGSDTGTDTATDTGSDTGSDTGTIPDTPFPPGISYYSDAPCAFPASITHSASDDRLYVSCGGVANGLFKSPPLDTAGDWTAAGAVTGYPSNHAMIDDQYAVIAHSAPDGFTIVDHTSGTAMQTVDFSAATINEHDTEPPVALDFQPNTPGGILVAGGRIYVATNNIDTPDYTDMTNTTFFPGTLLYFDYLGSGAVDDTSGRAMYTSGLNPTGLTQVDGSTIAVLSSGSYDPLTSEAAMEICSIPELACSATALGNVTAQASPTMPVTASGLVLAGVQEPDVAIVGVDASTSVIELDRAMPDVDNFISNICSYGDVAVMSDFGVFGSGGQLLYAHTSPSGWTGVPATPLMWGSVGPAVVVGDTLYATATSNDGMSGRIYEVSLAGMD